MVKFVVLPFYFVIKVVIMRIAKVLNNNAIITVNDQNKEVVVIGRGIAFKKKSGDLIEEAKIEKIFMDNESISEQMKTLCLKSLLSTWKYRRALSR